MYSHEKGPISTNRSSSSPPPDNFSNLIARQLETVTRAMQANEHGSQPVTAQVIPDSVWRIRVLLQNYPFSKLTNPHSKSAWELLNRAADSNKDLPPIFSVYLSKLVMSDVNISPDYWSISDYEQFLGIFDLSKPHAVPAHQRFFLKRTMMSMEGCCYKEIDDNPLNKGMKTSARKKAARAMCQEKLPEHVKQALTIWDESKPRNYRLQIGEQTLKFDSQEERIIGYLLDKYNLVSLVKGETLHVPINQHGAHSLDFFIPWARTFIEFHPASALDRKHNLHSTESIERRIGNLTKPPLAGAEALHIWELDQLWDVIDYLQTIDPAPGETKPSRDDVSKRAFYRDLEQAKTTFTKLKTS